MHRREPPFRQPLLFQPVERATLFSFSHVVEETRSVWFPAIDSEVEVRFGSLGPLASVWYHRMGFDRHLMVFHPILNRPDVPLEVVRFIAKHELTHLVMPADGHPPAFWRHELAVAPERAAAWAWIFQNLGRSLRHGRGGLRVVQSWRAGIPRCFTPYQPHLPFDDPPWTVLCPGGGAQLRLRPAWSPNPAPLARR